MAVRLATTDDLALLPAIEVSAAEPFRAYPDVAAIIEEGGTLPVAELEAALAAGLLWVADDDGAGLVGFLAAGMMDRALFIQELDTAARWQGRGFGRALLDAAISEARARGLPHVALTTFDAIPWNRPWYERCGFRLAAEPPPELAQRLRLERERWDPVGWDRCAMLLPLRT